jgi:hypothetical protein
MLTKRYLPSAKNLQAVLQKIIDGTAPKKFNTEHLKGLGFKSSNDRAIIPLLKDLGFLSEDGTPTQRYNEYRDKSRSRAVLGEALKEAYADVFHIREKPSSSDRDAIHGKFKTTHNVSDRVADLQTATFLALLKLADLDAAGTKKKTPKVEAPEQQPDKGQAAETPPIEVPKTLSLRYNIEIHLPATKDVEVYNAIFKALKAHLGE